MPDASHPLINFSATRLQDVARTALRQPNAELLTWQSSGIDGGFGTLTGESSVTRVSGTARVDDAEFPWSTVLKMLAPLANHNDPNQFKYWKREMLLHGSGILDELPPGLSAPKCYGCDESSDGKAMIWLEDIEQDSEHNWSIARWALAGRHLGQFNGAYASGRRELPRTAWLGGRRLRMHLDQHAPLVPRIAIALTQPETQMYWTQSIVDEIGQLWKARDVFCDALERLPQSFGHGDAIRRNLISRRGADGMKETVGVDWAFAGYYALGEDSGQTLSVASAFNHLDPADLGNLDSALFESYLQGLEDAGWRGDSRQVRFAYTSHAALRNVFNVVGALPPDHSRRAELFRNQGLTWEDLAQRRADIRPFLLKLAREAHGLLDQI